ncbi:hypothetical protein QJS66_13420 [Kocuria rhizophila]|nr:hypothetical protein QJS66_13420 [Kocuria rhizophila]
MTQHMFTTRRARCGGVVREPSLDGRGAGVQVAPESRKPPPPGSDRATDLGTQLPVLGIGGAAGRAVHAGEHSAARRCCRGAPPWCRCRCQPRELRG